MKAVIAVRNHLQGSSACSRPMFEEPVSFRLGSSRASTTVYDMRLTCGDPLELQIGQVSDVAALHAKL
jgi:hypothetical protein